MTIRADVARVLMSYPEVIDLIRPEKPGGAKTLERFLLKIIS